MSVRMIEGRAGRVKDTALVARFAAALRASALPAASSPYLGVRMNARGLMELIVLEVGLDLDVLTPKLFAMLVILAVVTTLATSPVPDALRLDEEREPSSDALADPRG